MRPTLSKLFLGLVAAMCIAICQAKTPEKATSPKTKPLKILTTEQATALQALVDKTKKNLVFVQGGSFQMGDFGPIHNAEKLPYYGGTDSIVLHKVTLDSFSMSAYKSTYEDYDIYTDITGQEKIGQKPKRIYLKRRTAPAGVTWQDARNYCQWLGQHVGTPLDLPTEAQWEYAARNRGQFVVFATDNGKLDMGRNMPAYDWLEEHNKDGFFSSMYEVGMFPPTPLGLYDMASNGHDWTLDWYDETYYSHSPERNPTGPTKGVKKVLRGNSNMEQSSLEMRGMTIVRDANLPVPEFKDGSHIRCVANSPSKIE